MKTRHSLITLAAVAALAGGTQAAQAHMLAGDSSGVALGSGSSKATLAVMTAAGINFHARANYKNEGKLGSTSLRITTSPARPDDRSGPRGV
jgi:hypothetical protein